MVEFALVLPLFLIVMFIIADFGVGFSRWLVITNSTREGARYGVAGAPASAECGQATVDGRVECRTIKTANGLLDSTNVSVNFQDFGGDVYPADAGDAVVVNAEYDYGLITPLGQFLSLAFGSITLSSCSDMRLELAVEDAGGLGGSGCY